MVRIPESTDAVPIEGLRLLGLRIAIPTPWRANSFGALFFRITSPVPGTRVPRGSVVTLQTDGLPGMPWQHTGHHVVPRVLNVRLDKAIVRINAAGLPWAVQARPLPPTLPLGPDHDRQVHRLVPLGVADLFASYCVASQTPAASVRVTTHEGSTKLHEVKLTAKPC